MTTDPHTQLTLDSLSMAPSVAGPISLDKEKFLQMLNDADATRNLAQFKAKIAALRCQLPTDCQNNGRDTHEAVGHVLVFRRDVLLAQLDQMLEALTLERSKYYLRRLRASVEKSKAARYSDINLLRWQEYDHVLTDSLWLFDRRDSSGAHIASYWGNFVPQIPRQLMLRYTRAGEWVLDAFSGSGTTLIECRKLGRNGIGVELNETVARQSLDLVQQEPNLHGVSTDVVIGDSSAVEVRHILRTHGIRFVQLLLLHPPYHDIIKFSDDARDLSNAPNVQKFLEMFGEVVDNSGGDS